MMKLGCGLFGLAMNLELDFDGTLEKLAEYGFTAVEPLYSFRNDPAFLPDSKIPEFLRTILWNEEKVIEMLPKLEKVGLTISSMHVGILFGVEKDVAIEELINFSKNSGIKNFMTSLEFDTVEKCKDAVQLLNYTNDALNPYGASLGYHNHFQEFSHTIIDGVEKTLMEYFLENTSDKVKLQLDTGWQLYAGDDVLTFMQKYEDRIISVHLKDMIPQYLNVDKNDIFTAVGNGVLPTKDIIKILPKHMMEHGLMIDQDGPTKGNNLLDDLRDGALYLKKIGE